MGIDLKKAFAFVPQDSDWIQKVFIGGLLLFLPTFVYIFPGIRRLFFDPLNYSLIAFFLTFEAIVILAVTGYFFKAIHNRIVHDKEGIPSWKNFTYYVLVGFKAYVGGTLFSLPFVALYFGIAFFIPLSFSIHSLPYLMLAGFIHVLYTIFFIPVALNFSLDFKITSFLNVKKAFEMIKGKVLEYAYLVLYSLLIALAYAVVSLILSCAQILALLLPFVSFYVYLVYADLFAQFVEPKAAEDMCDEKECYI